MMAPSTRAVFLALLVAPAAGTEAFLATDAERCGPATKVSISTSEDAAGTSTFADLDTLVDGECTSMTNAGVKLVKFCGAGTLTLSRMSCDRHDYKVVKYEHLKTEYTSNCETIDVQGTFVEGYLGSVILDC